MNREQAYHLALDALAKMQWNTAIILEAKAAEAEKVRTWLLTHFTNDTHLDQKDRLSTSLQFHDQTVEVIDSLSKLCHGLNRNMKAILEPEGEGAGEMGAFFGGMNAGETEA
ncbi:restriction endonuclease subunit S [Cohnella thailandensis]|uniref:Restriction endonuclease subunit S n=1 Tax=Cohnella thailandensis TaxID=557557 RepID=A0A841SYY8_9BACL|nr:restriction endonuclease subunit S [Cohnella thailandensis]MBB6635846.1 restriction endonuclease subunit S [Cohnella thailandensis]MBP1976224.1 hypothetical protein [Cohnella thailandensis]